MGGERVLEVPAVKGFRVKSERRRSARTVSGRMRAASGLWPALALALILILFPGDGQALREGQCEGETLGRVCEREGAATGRQAGSPWGCTERKAPHALRLERGS